MRSLVFQNRPIKIKGLYQKKTGEKARLQRFLQLVLLPLPHFLFGGPPTMSLCPQTPSGEGDSQAGTASEFGEKVGEGDMEG